jgi:hypothetical protein
VFLARVVARWRSGNLVDWSMAAGPHAAPAAVHAAVTEDQLADDTNFAVAGPSA